MRYGGQFLLLSRRLAAEYVGTTLLVVAVVGSGIMAETLSDDVGVQLLANAIATGGALFALITILGPVSGASFNPIVSAVRDFLDGSLSWRLVPEIAAQIAGAISGSLCANAMFAHALFETSDKVRTGGPIWFSEVVATVGLVVVIFGAIRTHQSQKVAALVAGWITGAYWFTSSTSLANPAVTIGRALSRSFAGIAPKSVPMFVVMQSIGGVVAVVLVMTMWPRDSGSR